MLRWLPSVRFRFTERTVFFKNILLLVCGAHVGLFLVMFFASKMGSQHDSFKITMHQSGVTYVLMPLQKKVAPKSPSGAVSGDGSKSNVVNYEQYLQQKQLSKKVSPVAKNAQKAAVKTRGTVKQQLQSMMKKENATAALITHKNKVSVKSKAALKSTQKSAKHKVEKKRSKKKTVMHTSRVQPQVAPEPKQDVAQLPEALPAVVEPINAIVAEQETTAGQASFDVDNVVFVGYEQLDECVIGSKIQHAIEPCWMPPVGIASGTECKVQVAVSDQGLATSANVVQSSGILVYDTAARTALMEVEYPQEIWGKTITIVLAN